MSNISENFPSSPLGVLELVEVIFWYDGPQAAIYKSNTDQFYINAHASSEEEEDIWLYVPVSIDRLSSVMKGLMEWRDVFTHPETVLYVVSWKSDTPTVVETDPATLPEKWLPTPGVTLGNQENYSMDIEEAQAWNEWIVSTRGNASLKDAFLAGRATLRNEAALSRVAKYILADTHTESDPVHIKETVDKLLYLYSKIGEENLLEWENKGFPENWNNN